MIGEGIYSEWPDPGYSEYDEYDEYDPGEVICYPDWAGEDEEDEFFTEEEFEIE